MARKSRRISESQLRHISSLIPAINATSAAVGTLSNAQIAGNVVSSDQVEKVSADLAAMVAELRSIVAPK